MTAGGTPEGVAGAYLKELTVEGARALAEKIRKHRAAVLSDPEGFEIERELSRTAEYKSYRRYVRDSKLRNVILAGLLLRKFETNPDYQWRIDQILQTLYKNIGPIARWQAEFVQRGMLQRVIQSLERQDLPAVKVGEQVETLLNRIEKHTRFVREDDHVERLAEEIRIRVLESTPETFIIFGKGRVKDLAKQAVHEAMRGLSSAYKAQYEEYDYDFVAMIGLEQNGKVRIEWWE